LSMFRDRLALVENGAQEFLEKLLQLGGYCTVEHAKRLALAKSPTRTLAQLRALEAAGFLRRVAVYPLIFQVTKSTTRLLGSNSRARRRHSIETIHTRLLGVSFYLEARQWPAFFVFDHAEKIDTLVGEDCPISALPHRAREPYLRGEFVLCLPDGGIGIAIVDEAQRSPFLQLQRLMKDFVPAAERVRERLQLIVAVGAEGRDRLYTRMLRHPHLQSLSSRKLEDWVRIHRVQDHIRTVPTIIWPAQDQTDTERARDLSEFNKPRSHARE
jgi:hypothetical protein